MESETLARRRIVVDGSNIATEGRTLPSLAQLNEAIETFLEEFKGFTAEDVTVVVDASFGHRIDPSEVRQFEEAIEHGEMVTPPAGAIGRGDGFILRIAEKSGALVLSNDSFQEFHAERPWLFEAGRLIGGKPVPGVGWVFTPRTPVRGAPQPLGDRPVQAGGEGGGRPARRARQRSGGRRRRHRGPGPVPPPPIDEEGRRRRDADDLHDEGGIRHGRRRRRLRGGGRGEAGQGDQGHQEGHQGDEGGQGDAKAAPAKKATKATKAVKATKATKGAKATPAKKAAKTTKTAAAPAAEPDPAASRPRGGAGEALNDPMTFITFVADHPIGSTMEGEVVSFTSHGAHIDVGGMLCHVPLRGLGDPAPARARSVLAKGETRTFELVSLDAPRRRAELTLPGIGDSATA